MAQFVIRVEPARDRLDLQGIAERLDALLTDEGLRVWYQRDVRALLERVIRLENEREQLFWEKAANQQLRDELTTAQGRVEILQQQFDRQRRDLAEGLMALAQGLTE